MQKGPKNEFDENKNNALVDKSPNIEDTQNNPPGEKVTSIIDDTLAALKNEKQNINRDESDKESATTQKA